MNARNTNQEKMNESFYLILCSKAVAGEISEAEQVKLDKWLERDPENREYFKGIAKAWAEAEASRAPVRPEVYREWDRLKQSLGLRQAPARQARFLQIRKVWREKLAAMVAIRHRHGFVIVAAVGVLALVILVARMQFSGSSFEQLMTGNGQTEHLNLPDGSEVDLNSGSMLRFAKSFSDTFRLIEFRAGPFHGQA
jgi:ferric-dicitrate binding protein FerR (iron transport regulator)